MGKPKGGCYIRGGGGLHTDSYVKTKEAELRNREQTGGNQRLEQAGNAEMLVREQKLPGSDD